MKPESDHLIILADHYSIDGNKFTAEARCRNKKFRVFYTLSTEEDKLYFEQLVAHLELDVDYAQSDSFTQLEDSYEVYLRNHAYNGVVKIDKIHSLHLKPSASLFERIVLLRRRIVVYCQRVFFKENSDYLLALCFGWQTSSFKTDLEKIQFLGIGHLFALSGMHVVFFLNFFKKIFLRLAITIEDSKWLLIIVSITYFILSGASKTILRSLLQFNFQNFGISTYKSFCLTTTLLLLLYPQLTLDMGTSLSVLTTFILLIFGKQFKSSLDFEIVMLPFYSLYFSSWQILSVAFSPIFSKFFKKIILPVYFLTIILSLFINVNFINARLKILNHLIDCLFKITPNQLILGKVMPIIFLIWLLAIILYFEYPRLRKWSLVMMVFCLLITKYPPSSNLEVVSSGLENYFIVREWPSKVIVFAGPTNPKVRTREQWKLGKSSLDVEKVLIPKLKEMGIHKIDYWIQSHISDRHLSSLHKVHQTMKIKHTVVTNRLSPTVHKELISNNITYDYINNQDQFGQFTYDGTTKLWFGQVAHETILVSNQVSLTSSTKFMKLPYVDDLILMAEEKEKPELYSSSYTVVADGTYENKLKIYKMKGGVKEIEEQVSSVNLLQER